LTSDREPLINKSLPYFESALKSGTKKDVDALLGKAKYLEIKKQYHFYISFFTTKTL